MAFKKGESGNPSGRPVGAKNKAPIQIKEMIESMLTENSTDLQKTFKELKGRDKIKAMTDLLPYAIPKLQSTSLDIDLEKLTDDDLDALYNRIINNSKV